MKIGIISLGCAKNLVDSELLLGLFKDPFFKYEKDKEKCDAIIINTCGFILSAKEESINTIYEIAELKKNKLKYLIVTGCLTQRYYEKLKEEIKEVDLFIKIDDYKKANRLLEKLFNHKINNEFGMHREFINTNHSAYLKISDGCSNRCAYCAIPLIRGNNKSIPISTLVKQAKQLRKSGVKELNVVAQDTTNYGLDLYNKLSLSKLLKELDKIDFEWIRILYMYPDEITDDLLMTIKNSKRIIPYFDIPIQHGNNKILKLMNRRGSVSSIKKIVNKIRKMFINPIIRTTIIVGFPGEDKAAFNDTVNLIDELKFDSLGAFTYSKEEDTKAFLMKKQVSKKTSEKRLEKLMLKQRQIVSEKMQNKIGRQFRVIVDNYDAFDKINYCRSYESAPDDVDYYVLIPGKRLVAGDLYNVIITHYLNYDLIGKIV